MFLYYYVTQGVDTSTFYPRSAGEIGALRMTYGLHTSPYILVVGSRMGYKNMLTLYTALQQV
jgi:hypothetical protein